MNARNTLLAFGLACVAGLSLLTQAQNAPTGARTALDAHRSLGQARTFRNLTLIPVYDTRATVGDDYITLDEGLKSGVVTVKESSNGGDVNTLYLTNKGKKPLYLMAGEVVLGGQQDRCIGTDSLVSAGTKKLPITVFCVEHGRWTGQANFARSAPTVASLEIRSSAQAGALAQQVANSTAASPVSGENAAPGQYAGTGRVTRLPVGGSFAAGNVNGSAAHVVARARISQTINNAADSVGNSQQQVWDKVAAKNRHFKTESDSGTYRNLLSLSGGEAQKSITPYINAFAAGLPADGHLVGVVAAVNGKVVSADIFGNTTLYRKLWPKLLRSYAADAAEAATAKQKTQPVTAAAASRFLQRASLGKDQVKAGGVTGVNTRLMAAGAVTYSLAAPVPAAKAAATPALHENVLGK